ncbi:MAG: DUF2207 domain-containing protein, partial [Gammaproteobacteria bacterium]|nr:DUF2207 domain-containing protein [Gammaproteobacteria bacterium]
MPGFIRHFSCILLLLFFHQLHAVESILNFHSNIQVNVDGTIDVTETITVRAEQDRIRRGIYRDFPTTYEDRFGNRHRVDFEVVSVLRDGSRENYFTQGM